MVLLWAHLRGWSVSLCAFGSFVPPTYASVQMSGFFGILLVKNLVIRVGAL